MRAADIPVMKTRRGRRTETGQTAVHGASALAVGVAAGAIVLGALAVYLNSFAVPFVLDDPASIVDNPSIRTLWPLTVPLSPPSAGGLTVGGRPVLNLSLALNYAVSGTAVWSYHLLNLAIHAAAGLVLFGILRRTFAQPRLGQHLGARGTLLAATTALLWTLHPLQTSAVTYVVQRAESLGGLFYLLTLYAFIRGSGASKPGWLLASLAFCVLGVATKEVVATAPLLVLLYDRTFVAGTFREAWKLRSWYYPGLFASWALLAWLIASIGGRGGTVGFGAGVDWWPYVLTQCRAVVHYLRLAVWPNPLVFDYGTPLVENPIDVLPQAILLLLLAFASAYALRRRPALGFLGASFLLILAPTSSVVPVATQTMAEHRMYLPLAAVIALAVVVLDRRRPFASDKLAVGAVAAAAIALGALTVQRNAVYRTPVSLWGDTVEKVPGNSRAHNALGLALAAAGRPVDALDQIGVALELDPGSVEYNNNLAMVLADLGHLPEALEVVDMVAKASPGLAAAHDTRGYVLAKMERTTEAVTSYEEALRLEPNQAESHNGLGLALVALGRLPEAAGHYEEAIRIRPDYLEAHRNLYALRAQRQVCQPR
jgi:Flp pilus assembly protein TadD